MVFSCTLGVVGVTWGYIQVRNARDDNWKTRERMYAATQPLTKCSIQQTLLSGVRLMGMTNDE